MKDQTLESLSSRNELVIVGFFQNLLDIVRVLGLFQESAKCFILKLFGNILQSFQVIISSIERRNKHEEKLNLFPVQAFEINTIGADSDRANNFLDTGVFGVWNGNATANSSTSQFFPVPKLLAQCSRIRRHSIARCRPGSLRVHE